MMTLVGLGLPSVSNAGSRVIVVAGRHFEDEVLQDSDVAHGCVCKVSIHFKFKKRRGRGC